tara:strand:- start:1509 stop:1685 length:177 start_codon:yes stop_codon:yes gene_type:complete
MEGILVIVALWVSWWVGHKMGESQVYNTRIKNEDGTSQWLVPRHLVPEKQKQEVDGHY